MIHHSCRHHCPRALHSTHSGCRPDTRPGLRQRAVLYSLRHSYPGVRCRLARCPRPARPAARSDSPLPARACHSMVAPPNENQARLRPGAAGGRGGVPPISTPITYGKRKAGFTIKNYHGLSKTIARIHFLMWLMHSLYAGDRQACRGHVLPGAGSTAVHHRPFQHPVCQERIHRAARPCQARPHSRSAARRFSARSMPPPRAPGPVFHGVRPASRPSLVAARSISSVSSASSAAAAPPSDGVPVRSSGNQPARRRPPRSPPRASTLQTPGHAVGCRNPRRMVACAQ